MSSFLPPGKQLDIIRRGTVEILPEDELRDRLQTSHDADQPLRIKAGFDPTAPDLHFGHTVLMEKMGRRSQVPTLEAKSHFKMTDREFEIVAYVAEGRTNKEIAEVLEISEHTVKEHIKHILRKTAATTRTGILSQILKYA